ncbi:MAG: chemotaxis protein CheW [Pseudomonadota bacterium]
MSTDLSRNTGLQQPGAMTILTFRLMGEIFALAVERVHEIIDPLPVTLVPRTDPFVPGLINVRGSVVPVADLRQRLDMPPAEATEHSRMVVLDVLIEDTPTKVALVADSVDQVSEVDGSRIEPVPEIGMRFPPRFLAGVAKRDGELIILLRVETVFEPPQGRQPHAA